MNRERLPVERQAVTKKFSVGGVEGYITVGLYDNGNPGEVFITVSKSGSTLSGLLDAFATSLSMSLQHGVSLDVLCKKFAGSRFEPAGWTGEDAMGYACSLVDYVARWMWLRFGAHEPQSAEVPVEIAPVAVAVAPAPTPTITVNTGGRVLPLCVVCGQMMMPSGACYRCESCGSTSGCS